METKTQLRSKAKQIRSGLDMPARSRELCAKLRGQNYYKRAKHVMIFHPKPGEVDVLELLEDNKNFYLPRCRGEYLEVCPYSAQLTPSKFSVMEPCTDAIDTDNLDLVIVPALMADKKHYRLGYGGGFYDRFLGAVTSALLLPQELIVDTLPTEAHDVQITHLIY
jgi:5-formyltetrahydrofolate cyclo-ligase